MQIKTAVVEKKGEYAIRNAELGEPREGEVLVKMKGSGICHTDLAVMNQIIPTPLPIALGHEGSGTIASVGRGVTEFKTGDHVVISFSSCGECGPCRHGQLTGCEHFDQINFGTTIENSTSMIKMDGSKVANLFGQSSLSTYCVVKTKNLIKVPYDELDISLLGPLACGVQTGAGTVLNKLKPGAGESIAIFGCGGVGLSAVMAAALTACKNIIAVDVVPERLKLAKELGATHTINGKELNAVDEIKSITNGGAEYAIESAAIPFLIQQAIRCTRSLGKIVTIGGAGDTTIHIQNDLLSYNRTIIGVVEGASYPQEFIPVLLSYYKEGRFPFDKLIKTYRFDDLANAIEDMKRGTAIKPVIVFDN
jgi:aryl-alcohol dehydrogenase